MTKKETIWRYVLHEAFREKGKLFTQKEVAALHGFSTSTVFHALKAPRSLGAVEVRGRFFRVIDSEKLLLLFASHRHLQKDLVYKTRVDQPVMDIEGSMPPEAIFGAFSAYRLMYDQAPADYSRVYVYADPEIMKKRFPEVKKGQPNLFVLKPDPFLKNFGSVTSPVQTFVDLWNISEWYAKPYLEALKEKLFTLNPKP